MPALKRITAIGVAVVMSIALVACGDDDDEGAESTTTAAPAGQATVDIEMKDYAYTVSGALTEGGTLRVKNTGKELHMITVSKFKPGKTVTDLVKAFQQPPGGDGAEETTTTAAAGAATTTSAAGGEGGEEEEEDPTADIVDDVEAQGGAGIFAPGGPTLELTGNGLEPGNYALMCFINVEGEQTPHTARGMIASLSVVDGTAPAAPTADATYKVEKGKAITGPATLTAGRHVLKIEATGEGAGDLEPTLYKPKPGTGYVEADRLFKSWEDTGVPKGGAASLPGQIIANLFDLRGQTTQYMAVDFTPGTYLLFADDTDDEDEPTQPRELIRINVT